MPAVASVRLRYAAQEYWFDPGDVPVQEGDHVIVKTARGTEIGLCTAPDQHVEQSELKKPLKPIVRVAMQEDLDKADELAERAREAMPVYRELVAKHGLDMKPVDVDFMFDEAHATFYFTSEERVDFRALVRELASEFHVRVDMRQIGVRDEARMCGGFGHCGEELCCARLGGSFKAVSIRMAKEQDLSLNPSKISGLCGRLMCCLRYEYDAYKDFKGRAPKKNALIDTPLGLAKVVEFDTPRETVRVRFEDGKSMNIPLSALDTGDKVAREGENLRPCHITQEKFEQIVEELHHDQTLAMMGDRLFSDDPDLTDKTAKAGEVQHNPKRKKRRSSSGSGQGSGQGSKSRGKGKSGGQGRGQSQGQGRAGQGKSGSGFGSHDQRKRRRSVSVAVDGEQSKSRQSGRAQGSAGNASKPHPGQHSSTVSGDSAHSGANQGGTNKKRRRRRRRSSGGNNGGQGAQGSASKAPSGSTDGGNEKAGA